MNKIYRDVKESIWWSGMKKEIAQYVVACLTCQKTEVEHQRPGGLLQHWIFLSGNEITLLWILLLIYQDQ